MVVGLVVVMEQWERIVMEEIVRTKWRRVCGDDGGGGYDGDGIVMEEDGVTEMVIFEVCRELTDGG